MCLNKLRKQGRPYDLMPSFMFSILNYIEYYSVIALELFESLKNRKQELGLSFV